MSVLGSSSFLYGYWNESFTIFKIAAFSSFAYFYRFFARIWALFARLRACFLQIMVTFEKWQLSPTSDLMPSMQRSKDEFPILQPLATVVFLREHSTSFAVGKISG